MIEAANLFIPLSPHWKHFGTYFGTQKYWDFGNLSKDSPVNIYLHQISNDCQSKRRNCFRNSLSKSQWSKLILLKPWISLMTFCNYLLKILWKKTVCLSFGISDCFQWFLMGIFCCCCSKNNLFIFEHSTFAIMKTFWNIFWNTKKTVWDLGNLNKRIQFHGNFFYLNILLMSFWLLKIRRK